MTLMLRYAARSDVGLLRTNNEDAVYAGPRLLAVADGMGGHAAGDVASAVTIATLAPLDDDEPPADVLGALATAIRQANEHLRQMVEADEELAGMGTTLTALLWSGSRLGLAHIGDSRAYLLRDGELTQITDDHTLVQRLVDEGQLDEADVPTHPQRSVILRVLNGRPDDEADLSMRDVRVGDRYLLCSDGLSGVVSKDTICDTLGSGTPDEAVEALVGLALRGGAPDNVTCIVCDVVESGDAAVVDPVVGGSVLDGDDPRRIRTDTAAGRAAALRGRHGIGPRRASTSEHPHGRWRTARGPLLVLALLIVVAGLIFGGTWWYAQHQYYIASNGTNVEVYRGISGSFLGISFSTPIEDTHIPVDSLPAYKREAVKDGVGARSRAAAERVVDQLRQEQEANSTPSTPSTPSMPSTPSTSGATP
jgi:serine/threonine protein phosphatase PrpC